MDQSFGHCDLPALVPTDELTSAWLLASLRVTPSVYADFTEKIPLLLSLLPLLFIDVMWRGTAEEASARLLDFFFVAGLLGILTSAVTLTIFSHFGCEFPKTFWVTFF